MRRHISVRTSSAIGSLHAMLLAAVRNDEFDNAHGAVALAPELLVAASRDHGIEHVMLAWLRKVASDHPAIEILQQRNVKAAMFNLRAVTALRAASASLGRAGIRSVALKGPVLAALTNAKCRHYGDLDMLIDPRDLERALIILQETGASLFPHGGWKHFHDHEHAQLPVLLPHNIALDLHWHLCSLPHMRESFRVASATELLGRSRTLSTAMGELHVLDATDMLIHTAGHAAWSGGDRLGWFVDTDAVVRSTEIDWDEVVRRVQLWRLDALVGNVLTQTRALVGSPIPHAVTRSMRGGSLGAALRIANHIRPVHEQRTVRSSRRLIAIHARSGLLRTAAALSVRAATVGTNRVRGIRTETTPTFDPVLANDDDWRGPYLSFAQTGKVLR
jgi:hypothetical protein